MEYSIHYWWKLIENFDPFTLLLAFVGICLFIICEWAPLSLLFLPPATKLGQGNVFTGICDSVHGGHVWLPGGVCGCWGACVVAGGHAWLPGAFMVAGGVHGCQGACMVVGVCMVASVCVWLPGVSVVGGCMVAGGVHGCGGGMHRIRQDTVNEQVVRILLECILVASRV